LKESGHRNRSENKPPDNYNGYLIWTDKKVGGEPCYGINISYLYQNSGFFFVSYCF